MTTTIVPPRVSEFLSLFEDLSHFQDMKAIRLSFILLFIDHEPDYTCVSNNLKKFQREELSGFRVDKNTCFTPFLVLSRQYNSVQSILFPDSNYSSWIYQYNRILELNKLFPVDSREEEMSYFGEKKYDRKYCGW
jgi:hypothetical protein